MAKKGDMVRFLNSVGGGVINRIVDNIAYVEDEDGFETPVLLRECVVVGESSVPKPVEHTAVEARTAPKPSIPSKEVVTKVVEEELPIEETPEGEQLNITLAYEPRDLKRFSQTTFDAYFVNDSNYYLYFAYMTRGDSDSGWTTRYAGIVEPNIQVFIGEVVREDLPSMDHVAIQYISFKRDKEFRLKNPALVQLKLDTTKFAKLHCFRDNIYFDIPVLAFDIVKADLPYKMAPAVDSSKLEEAMQSKIRSDRQPKKRVVKKQPKHDRRGETLVVDLHIGELVDSIRGLSNADMLNLQVDEFRKVMDENRNNKGQKIVFIHGKGEGVLRNAIMKELNHRYKGNDVQDASFREYGFGATQVTIL